MAAHSWFLVLGLGLFAAEQPGLAADTRDYLLTKRSDDFTHQFCRKLLG